jgi:hypothetical protein
VRTSAAFIAVMDPESWAISAQQEGCEAGRGIDKKHANPGKAVHITTTASISTALCLPIRTRQ